jgi:hypothetical protein
MKRPMLTPAACAFLGRRWQRRQVGGAQDSAKGTAKRRRRSLLPRAAPAVGGAGLRPAGAVGGEERA